MSGARGKKPHLQPVFVPGGSAAEPIAVPDGSKESKVSVGDSGRGAAKHSDAVKPVVYARIGSRVKLVTEDSDDMEEAPTATPPRAVRSPQSPKGAVGARPLPGETEDTALAALVHQTDASGKQKTTSTPISCVDVISRKRSKKRGFWARLCCCCGGKSESHVPPFGPIAPDESLLGPMLARDEGKKCLVLDLDETLVHSSFKFVEGADYVIPVEIEGTTHHVYVCKRPYCDEFLAAMADIYEVVVFTASLAKYADPLLDQLDKHKIIRKRLFRESCVHWEGNYVKDLSLLGRDIRTVIIIDNSPASFYFQPENAIACETYINQVDDRELRDMIKPLSDWAKSDVVDVRDALARWPGLASGACPGTATGFAL